MDPALQMGTDAPSTLVVHRAPGTVSAHGSPGTAPWLPAVASVVTCTVLYTPNLPWSLESIRGIICPAQVSLKKCS